MKASLIDKLLDRLDDLPAEAIPVLALKLLKQKGMLNQVIDALRESLFILDPKGFILFANRSAQKLAGANSNIQGKALNVVLPGIEWTSWFIPGRTHSSDLQIFYPQQKWLNAYLAPLDPLENDASSGYLLLLRDITNERQQTETDLANEAIGAVQLLAAGVAHEIGNPLNSLSIHLQLLKRKIEKLDIPETDSLSNCVNVAESEIKRLDLILKQFLNALRPSQLERENVSLNTLLGEILQLISPELEQRHIFVHLNLDDTLPELNLDPARMKQVLFNLLKNAWQAIPEEPNHQGLITIKSYFTPYEICLSITDNGTGISPEMMGTMFESFTTTKISGNGLGMFIVQRIVREHGGIIEINTKKDHGTSVTLRFQRKNRQVQLLSESHS